MSEQEENIPLKAVLYSSEAPDERQEARFKAFLKKKYGEVCFEFIESKEMKGGFRLEVGSDVYDWSASGRLNQLKEALTKASRSEGNVIPLLKETIHNWTPKAIAQETGSVLAVGDGIATVSGLDNAAYGEILLFSSGVRGMIQDLRKDSVGCILFGEDDGVLQGSGVKRTQRTAGVPVGEGFLGRVVNALGVPIDGLGEIEAEDYRPIERPAPGIIDRQPVNKPMETGILSIDSMFPIGRGQRELIIGDRQTGKTAIALDTVINQKGKDVVCIYVAIGQKNSSVARIVKALKDRDCFDYCIVVNASAGDSASLQYIAPYSGCAMAEYFMDKGKDVLIIYDDLSKHAIAYRTLSLLLNRSPGREAYPGDVFYLHSRLLERAAHLSDERGGGSITALPIVETQAGDVSAYIPTNIISITDGQIFLESKLFFAGQRPAVNVGLSVSRVGGAAQTKAMKNASGALRLDLAQYREMEVFNQFSSDLDEATRRQLAYGAGLMRLLRQPQYRPMKQHEQVVLLIAALGKVMQDIPLEKILDFKAKLLDHFETEYSSLCRGIDATGNVAKETREEILMAARRFLREKYEKQAAES